MIWLLLFVDVVLQAHETHQQQRRFRVHIVTEILRVTCVPGQVLHLRNDALSSVSAIVEAVDDLVELRLLNRVADTHPGAISERLLLFLY